MSRNLSQRRPAAQSPAVSKVNPHVAPDADPGGYETLTFGSVFKPPSSGAAAQVHQGPTPPSMSPQTSLSSSPEASVSPSGLDGGMYHQATQKWTAPGLPSPAPSLTAHHGMGTGGPAPSVLPVGHNDGTKSHMPLIPSTYVLQQADLSHPSASADTRPPNVSFPAHPYDLQILPHPQAFAAAGMPDGSVQYVMLAYPSQPYAVDAPWITHPPSTTAPQGEGQQQSISYTPALLAASSLPPGPSSAPPQSSSAFSSLPLQYGPTHPLQLYPLPPPGAFLPTPAYYTAPSSPTAPSYPAEMFPGHSAAADGTGWYAQTPSGLPLRASDGAPVGAQAWGAVHLGPAVRGRGGGGRGRGRGGRGGRSSGGGGGSGVQTNGKVPPHPPAEVQWAATASMQAGPSYGLGFVPNGPPQPAVGVQQGMYLPALGKPAASGWGPSGRRRSAGGGPRGFRGGGGGSGGRAGGPGPPAISSSTGSTPAPWLATSTGPGTSDVAYHGPAPLAVNAEHAAAPAPSATHLARPFVPAVGANPQGRAGGLQPSPQKPFEPALGLSEPSGQPWA